MNRIKLVIAVILAVLALIVIAQNSASVDTRLLFVTVTMPRAVLLFVTLAIGFVLGLLFALVTSKKSKPAG